MPLPLLTLTDGGADVLQEFLVSALKESSTVVIDRTRFADLVVLDAADKTAINSATAGARRMIGVTTAVFDALNTLDGDTRFPSPVRGLTLSGGRKILFVEPKSGALNGINPLVAVFELVGADVTALNATVV